MVEDDDDTREVLTLGMSLYGADVVAVSCAAEAMAELEKHVPRRHRERHRLARRGRPGADPAGPEAAASRGGRVPAVAVTAFTLSDDAEEATRAGFQRHFRKPVETQELFGAMAALAEKGRVERRRAVEALADKDPRTPERRADAERRTIVLV